MILLSVLRVLAAAVVVASMTGPVTFAQEVETELQITTKGNVTDVRVTGKGTYTDVIEEVLRLRQRGSDADEDVLGLIARERDSLPPPYYLEAARRSCQADPAAAFDWLSLYSVRARYDALRCTDETAMANVAGTLMALQFPECQARLQDRQLQLERVEATLARDDLFSGTSSPWWICSGGMSVIISQLDNATGDTPTGPESQADDWLKPASTWEAIRINLVVEGKASLEKHKAAR
jgi:hypothetical protein